LCKIVHKLRKCARCTEAGEADGGLQWALRFPGISAVRHGEQARRQRRATLSAKWDSRILRRSRAGDRQTARVGRSAFRLTREGKVFECAAPMLL
jgi:hypothetical protein